MFIPESAFITEVKVQKYCGSTANALPWKLMCFDEVGEE